MASARRLGILTVDLVTNVQGYMRGMDAAERRTAQYNRQRERDLRRMKASAKNWAAAAAAAVAAAGAAVAALTVETVRAAKAVNSLADSANATATEIQRFAFAARAAGVEQEQLGKIFEQANRRMGRFLQTGGGQLERFFDELAPAIGVTADEFRGLSGPQVLLKYHDVLQRSNLSQAEMAYHMDQLARGSRSLVPILQDSGDAIQQLGDWAEKAGVIMSDDLIESSLRMSAVMELSRASIEGMRRNIASGMMPALTDLSVELFVAAEQGDDFKRVGEAIGNAVRGLTVLLVTHVTVLEVLGRGYKGLSHQVISSHNTLDKFAKLVAAVSAGPAGIARYFKELYKGATEDPNAPLRATLDDLEDLVNRRTELVKRLLGGDDEGATASSETSRAKALIDLITEIKKAMQSVAAGEDTTDAGVIEKMAERVEALRVSLLDETEMIEHQYTERLNLLTEALEAEAIVEEEHSEILQRIVQDREDALAAIEQRAAAARLSGIQTALGQAATLMNSSSKELFEVGKVAAIANATIDMYEGIMKAWRLGPIVGPPLAAMVAAAGASNIAAIQSTRFGGGRGGASSAAMTQSAPAAQAGTGFSGSSRTVYLSGIDADSFVRAGTILEMVNEELADGGRLVFSGG